MARINVIDCASLFSVADATAKLHDVQRYNFNYTLLRQRLADARKELGFGPAETNLAIVSVDPSSDPQMRFVDALGKLGYEVDAVDFHDAFVSLPPGQLPGPESGYRSIISFAPRMAYLAGLLAKSPDSELLVVTHSFDVYWPLQTMARRLTRGRAGLAYFSSMLDFRWRRTIDKTAAQSSSGSIVKFYDLQGSLFELLGARDIQPSSERSAGGEVWARI
jgi:hypothetical protein